MNTCVHYRQKNDEKEQGPYTNNSEGQISKEPKAVDEPSADPYREEKLMMASRNIYSQITGDKRSADPSLEENLMVVRKNISTHMWRNNNIFLGKDASLSLQPGSMSNISTAGFSASCTSLSCSSFLSPKEIISFDGANTRAANRYEFVVNQIKAQMHYGMNPNVFTTHGDRSCLMVAVLAGDFRFVKQLVEMGVNVNKRSQIGETALSLAKDQKRNDIANFLRSNGATEIKDLD